MRPWWCSRRSASSALRGRHRQRCGDRLGGRHDNDRRGRRHRVGISPDPWPLTVAGFDPAPSAGSVDGRPGRRPRTNGHSVLVDFVRARLGAITRISPVRLTLSATASRSTAVIRCASSFGATQRRFRSPVQGWCEIAVWGFSCRCSGARYSCRGSGHACRGMTDAHSIAAACCGFAPGGAGPYRMVARMDGRVVVGRAVELDSIEAFLGDVLYGPVALLLAGEVGIGKTILWEAGVEEAERRFGRVLTCRGVETEASLSFAALSELLAPVLSDAIPSLAAPRRRALEVALSLAEPALLVPDVHVIGLAVLDVLDVLATSGAVVVAIDDLQWVDLASASVLQVALRRLRDEPVGLLATVRTSPAVATPIELERGFPGGWLRRLPIGPLSVGALHHLLRGRVGLDLSRPDLLRVNEATAGNPFFAIELGRELGRLGTRRLAERASARLEQSRPTSRGSPRSPARGRARGARHRRVGRPTDGRHGQRGVR